MSISLALRLLIRAAKYRWKLDKPEIARMIRSVHEGDHVIDVGAHKGSYTYWLARGVGRAGRVLAIEPQANLCRELRESLGSCGFWGVEVLETALSNRAGSMTLHVPVDTSTQSATLAAPAGDAKIRDVEVRVATIDRLIEERAWPRFNFLKIDAEGHELEILEGAASSIARFKPTILVEAEARKHHGDRSHLEHLIAMLGQHGYRGWFNDGRAWVAAEKIDVDVHQNFGHGRFCNNFIFEVA